MSVAAAHRLVFDLDELQGVLGLVAVGRQNDGHRLPGEVDLVMGQGRVVRDLDVLRDRPAAEGPRRRLGYIGLASGRFFDSVAGSFLGVPRATVQHVG